MNIPGLTLILATACLGCEQDIVLTGESGSILGFEEYRECGGVLTISALYQSIISYKENETLGMAEFCTWTLLVEDNVGPFRMIISQNLAEGNGIMAYFWNSSGLSGYMLPRNKTDITFELPPLFLTLSTRTQKSNGFRITIPANGVQPSRLMYQAYHFEKDEGVFSYPTKDSGKEEYNNNERVSVVVHPLPRNSFKRKKVVLRILSTESNYDFIHVYTLRAYMRPEPDFRGRFSGTGTYEFAMENFDPVVFIFTSDRKGTGKGFSIEVKNHQYKEL